MNKLGLFSDFPKVSSKEWKQKIQYELQGEDYNEKMVWESPEGIKVKPFYHSDDLTPYNTFTDSPKNSPWQIGQQIFAGNTTLANKKALNAIAQDTKSLYFTIPSENIKIQELLKAIDIENVSLYFNLQFLSSSYTATILEFVKNASKNSYLNIDIIGHLARHGNWQYHHHQDYKILGEMLSMGHKQTLSVDLSLYGNSGANHLQQLAFGLAHANEYLHFLNEHHKNLLKKSLITFKVAVGSNYFFEIAKLKALRILFSTIAHEYDALKECHIIAIPTTRNKTLYANNTNLLRTTTECMAAILGGADTVINLPFDAIYRKDNDYSERLARNQLLLLKNESYFDKVNNPTDGSYYTTTLTQQLASKALDMFKQIEASGGFLVQLKQHRIQKKIRESAHKELESFTKLNKILVGTNKYASRSDKMKEHIEIFPFVKTHSRKTLIEPILEKRISEDWEQERLKNE